MRASPRAFVRAAPAALCVTRLLTSAQSPSPSHFIVPITAFLTSFAPASCAVAFYYRTSGTVVQKCHLSSLLAPFSD